ncbi:MAG: hypothetical protein ABW186_05725 [Rhodanobacteraceae bacterium]
MHHAGLARAVALASFGFATTLHAGGDPDPGFGADGKVVVDAGTASYMSQYSLARDAAGNLYVAGSVADEAGDDSNFVVVKLDANGALVTAFGDGGRKVVDFGGDDVAEVVLVDANGDVFLAGYSDASGSDEFAVAKLDATGELVGAFGDGGTRLYTFGGTSSAVFAATIDNAGKVLLAGTSNALGTYDFAVTRIDPDSGAIDALFHDDGLAIVGVGEATDDVNGIAIDAQGDIVVAGTMLTDGFRGDIAAIKLDASGHLVTGFGDGGKVTRGIAEYDFGFALALDADGSIVVAGQSGAAVFRGNISIVKWTSGGTPDAAFGDGGALVVDVDPLADGNVDVAYDLAFDDAGYLYVAGSSDAAGDDDFVAIRLDPAGNPDPSFGANGIATIDFGGDEEPRGIVRGASGELYLAGTSRQNGNAYFAVTKLSAPAATDDVIFRDGFDFQ